VSLERGSRLGPYEIVGPLGAGGMGEVYRARDTRLGRDVAVKVLPAGLSTDPTFRQRFEREARTIAQLQHPHVCTLHDIGAEQGIDYLVMEYLEGETLAARLGRGALPLDATVRIGGEIASAVAAAHGRGVVHRDIKPGNVALTEGGAKVLDFGLARDSRPEPLVDDSVSPTLAQPLTRHGALVGTVHYMSPELLDGGEASSRSDVWAIGCVLYEMVSGQRPFAGPSAARLMAAILDREPEPLGALEPSPPEALVDVISRCLRKNPQDRFADGTELLAGLRLASQELLARDRLTRAGPSASSSPTPSRDPGRRLLILPFSQPGADENLDYLCEGLAGSLIGKLVGIAGLQVLAHNTALHLHERGLTPGAAGREVGVDAVLTGRLRLVGDRLAIQTELLDVESGVQLWSERLKRPFGDVFDVEEEVARAVARELEVELGRTAEARVAARPTESSTAYRLYLEGRHFTYEGTPGHTDRAVDRYRAALQEDPSFAQAHAGLSLAFSWGAFFNYLPALDVRDAAVAAARRALDIDPLLPEAHAALGFALCFLNWDWEGSDRATRRGVELGPESTVALQSRYVCLLNLGHFEEGLELVRRFMEIDPLWVKGNQDLAFILNCAGRHEEALAQVERTLELDNEFSPGIYTLGCILLSTGRFAEAVECMRTIAGRSPFFQAGLAYALARAGDEAGARSIVEELERAEGEAFAAELAWARCALGDAEGAAGWAERAFERHSPMLVNMGWWPWLRELRAHPKYRELTARMNLPIVLTSRDMS
jgi:serine/threonine protein kinase/tetratricopeptide (TPR) repeat protein